MGRGATFSQHKTYITGETITASDRNADSSTILNNLDPSGIGSYFQNTTEMQAVSDPNPGGTPSVPADNLTHLKQLEYVLTQKLGTQYWYIFPDLKTIDDTDSPYTTNQNERLILADATGGAITINLPATSGLKDSKEFIIKKTDSSSNAVTIDGNSGETIDGSLTFILALQNEGVRIVHNGTNWFIVGEANFGVTNGDSHDHSEGDGAKIPQDGLADYVEGDTLLISDDAGELVTPPTYTKIKEITIIRNGVLRVKFTIEKEGLSGTGYGRIYVNDIAVGIERSDPALGGSATFSEDISGLNVQDKVQIYAKASDTDGVTVTDFRLYSDIYHTETITA